MQKCYNEYYKNILLSSFFCISLESTLEELEQNQRLCKFANSKNSLFKKRSDFNELRKLSAINLIYTYFKLNLKL